jgi:small-conductance mechanosensitive channel
VQSSSWRQWERWLDQIGVPAAAFLITLVALLALRGLAHARLSRRAGGYAITLLQTVRWPSLLWCLAAALAVALRFPEIAAPQQRLLERSIVIFLILSFSWFAAALSVRLIALYGERQRMPFAVVGLSRTLVYILVFAIGAMILLNYLQLSITPLVTALGVGGLAVALAFQDTLANFFAGVHILVETPIRVGDFIQLSTGEEGTVTDIGWRTTRLVTGGQNTVVVPNTKITTLILVNYSLPTRRQAFAISIVAGVDADPRRVLEIAAEEAARADRVLADPPPLAQLDPGLTPTHLQVKVIVHVADRMDQGPAASDVRMRIYERLRREGVPMRMETRSDAPRS